MSTAEKAKQRLRALSAGDFDHKNPTSAGWEDLGSVCDQLQAEGSVIECADDMFDLMERLDASDLGSPGALVHALESTGRTYETSLQESLRRKPSPLAVWMVNRILNSDRPDRDLWIEALTMAARHPLASDETRRNVEGFLARQTRTGHS